MSDAVHLLLTAAADDALRRAVASAGGAKAAIRLLLDRAHRLQLHGGSHEEIRALVDASDRVEAMARRARR